ncbi:MAG: PadR family transcriptional regulator [Deltaproteobacteria bacterium]|nr:PadR family transcriptional regulator [Deltaproteobacteria bacterium]
MSLRFVILGLLTELPRHGYAIQRVLEERFGELCDPGSGDVYRALAVLDREGLVRASATRVGRRPRRKVYEPSAAGRRELLGWLRDGSKQGGRVSRDEPFLRLLVAARSAPQLLPGLLDGEVRHRRLVLSALESQRGPLRGATSFLALVLGLRHEAALEEARAALRAADLCRRVLQRQRAGAAVSALLQGLARGTEGGAAQPPRRTGATA